jgi:hypothetical protein
VNISVVMTTVSKGPPYIYIYTYIYIYIELIRELSSCKKSSTEYLKKIVREVNESAFQLFPRYIIYFYYYYYYIIIIIFYYCRKKKKIKKKLWEAREAPPKTLHIEK